MLWQANFIDKIKITSLSFHSKENRCKWIHVVFRQLNEQAKNIHEDSRMPKEHETFQSAKHNNHFSIRFYVVFMSSLRIISCPKISVMFNDIRNRFIIRWTLYANQLVFSDFNRHLRIRIQDDAENGVQISYRFGHCRKKTYKTPVQNICTLYSSFLFTNKTIVWSYDHKWKQTSFGRVLPLHRFFLFLSWEFCWIRFFVVFLYVITQRHLSYIKQLFCEVFGIQLPPKNYTCTSAYVNWSILAARPKHFLFSDCTECLHIIFFCFFFNWFVSFITHFIAITCSMRSNLIQLDRLHCESGVPFLTFSIQHPSITLVSKFILIRSFVVKMGHGL